MGKLKRMPLEELERLAQADAPQAKQAAQIALQRRKRAINDLPVNHPPTKKAKNSPPPSSPQTTYFVGDLLLKALQEEKLRLKKKIKAEKTAQDWINILDQQDQVEPLPQQPQTEKVNKLKWTKKEKASLRALDTTDRVSPKNGLVDRYRNTEHNYTSASLARDVPMSSVEAEAANASGVPIGRLSLDEIPSPVPPHVTNSAVVAESALAVEAVGRVGRRIKKAMRKEQALQNDQEVLNNGKAIRKQRALHNAQEALNNDGGQYESRYHTRSMGAPPAYKMAFFDPKHEQYINRRLGLAYQPIPGLAIAPATPQTPSAIPPIAWNDDIPYNPTAPIFTPMHKAQPQLQTHIGAAPRPAGNPFDSSSLCSPFQRLSISPSPSLGSAYRGSPSRSSRSRSKDPLVATPQPMPLQTYLSQASLPPRRLVAPQPLLVISDLNGTLICRTVAISFKPRPGLTPFFDHIFANHTFMIWTSAQPSTCANIVGRLLKPDEQARTVAIWARDRLKLTAAQYKGNTQVYKKLETVWEDDSIQRSHPYYINGGRWTQSNTLLIDDSILKAAKQPFNLVNLPELTRELLILEEEAAQENNKKGVEGSKGRYQLRSAGVRVSSPESSSQGAQQPPVNRAQPDLAAKAFRHQLRKAGVRVDSPEAETLATRNGDQYGASVSAKHAYGAVLAHVAAYIDEAGWHEDVSSFVRTNPFRVEDGWAWKVGDGVEVEDVRIEQEI